MLDDNLLNNKVANCVFINIEIVYGDSVGYKMSEQLKYSVSSQEDFVGNFELWLVVISVQ